MTEAPKRIWVDTSGKNGKPYVTQGYLAAEPNTPYLRADIADDLLEALQGPSEERLIAAVDAVLHDLGIPQPKMSKQLLRTICRDVSAKLHHAAIAKATE